jgi:hypothetical protein
VTQPAERRRVPRSASLTPSQVHVGPFGKLAWFPFETLIAFLLVVTGIAGLDSPEEIAPGAPLWASHAISLVYLTAGMFMLIGLWKMNIPVEVFGLVCLIGGIAISTTTEFVFHGPDAIQDALTFLAVAWAAGVRLYELAKGRVMIQIELVNDERG